MTTSLYNKVIWSYQMMLKDKNTDFAANINCNTVTVPGVWPECHCHLSERRLESHTPHMTNRFQEGSTRSRYNGPKLGHSPLNKHLKGKKNTGWNQKPRHAMMHILLEPKQNCKNRVGLHFPFTDKQHIPTSPMYGKRVYFKGPYDIFTFCKEETKTEERRNV